MPHAGLVHRGEQHGGAEVVVAGVQGCVGRVEAVAHDGGLVADHVHSFEEFFHRVGIGDVVGHGWTVAVGLGEVGVEHDDVVAFFGQLVGDV
ncbi:hypothetical protein B0I31_107204 [Saccharothrix carnea]|uniref:Uncharacterized protein n=1 Tax=Saccharothrix carnea TaxID=1280637 RepID=A0A2P8I6P4_SACCR|nr:hypothetical protein B0I31_107204 [Saccharothrix carnea]